MCCLCSRAFFFLLLAQKREECGVVFQLPHDSISRRQEWVPTYHTSCVANRG